MSERAMVTVFAPTYDEAQIRARALFQRYYGEHPWIITGEHGEAVLAMGGDVLYWRVEVTARGVACE